MHVIVSILSLSLIASNGGGKLWIQKFAEDQRMGDANDKFCSRFVIFTQEQIVDVSE